MHKALTLFCTLLLSAVDFTQAHRRLLVKDDGGSGTQEDMEGPRAATKEEVLESMINDHGYEHGLFDSEKVLEKKLQRLAEGTEQEKADENARLMKEGGLMSVMVDVLTRTIGHGQEFGQKMKEMIMVEGRIGQMMGKLKGYIKTEGEESTMDEITAGLKKMIQDEVEQGMQCETLEGAKKTQCVERRDAMVVDFDTLIPQIPTKDEARWNPLKIVGWVKDMRENLNKVVGKYWHEDEMDEEVFYDCREERR